MARLESDREDLLRQATALVERAEFEVPGYDAPIVIGFRRDGAGSIFIGAEPVFQFNAKDELRRAYWRGLLVKAEQGELIGLRRKRAADEVQLIRHTLSAAETAEVLASLREHRAAIENALRLGDFQLRGQVPESVNVLERIRAWLAGLPQPPLIARQANAGG